MPNDKERIYNEAVMRFVRNTSPTETTIQQWERDYPGLRFRDYGHDRTGVLANINKSLEKFIYGRTYDREQIPDAMQRNGLMNLVSILNSLKASPSAMPYRSSAVQSNINPATGRSGFINPLDINNMGMTANNPPSPLMLGHMARTDARNPMRTSSIGQSVNMRANPLDEYLPIHDDNMMFLDRLAGNRGGPGGNVLVPANRTQTQQYNAELIIQQNPELARHLGLLKAIKGD